MTIAKKARAITNGGRALSSASRIKLLTSTALLSVAVSVSAVSAEPLLRGEVPVVIFPKSGEIDITEGLYIAKDSIFEFETLNLISGTVTVNGVLSGTGNTLNIIGADVVVDGGTVTDAQDINIFPAGSLTFTGAGTLAANTSGVGINRINNSGLIDVSGGDEVVVTIGGGQQLLNSDSGVITVDNAGSHMNASTVEVVNQSSAAVGVSVGVGAEMSTQELITRSGSTTVVDGTLNGLVSVGGGGAFEVGSTGVVTGSIENRGSLISSGELQSGILNTNVGFLTLSGGTVVGNVTNEYVVSVVGDTDVTGRFQNFSDSGQFSLTINDGATLTVAGGVENRSGASVEVDGELDGAVSNNGGALVNVGSTGSITGTVVNSGRFVSAGTLNSGLVNSGTFAVATLTGGVVDGNVGNTGDRSAVVVTGDVEITGALINDSGNSTGVHVASGATLMVGDRLENRSGSVVQIDGELDGPLSNNGGALVNVGSTGSITGTVVNSGRVVSAGTLNSGLANSGTFAVATLTGGVVDGNVGNTGDRSAVVVSGDVEITGALINDSGNSTGVHVESGATLMVGDRLENRSGSVVQIDGELDGNVSNNAGASTIVSSSGAITGGLITNTGSLRSAGTLGDLLNSRTTDLQGGTITGNLDNTGTGTVEVSGDTTVDGDVNNDSTAATSITVNAGQTLSIGGTLNNGTASDASVVDILAGGTLEAGVIENVNGTIEIGDGATLAGTSNTLNNAATINVAANGTLTDAGDINNLATGVINFNGATGTATFASTGTGVILNDGDINVNGAGAVDVTGNLTNNSTLDILAGAMTGIGTLQNNSTGVITVAATTTLGATSIINEGSLNANGNLTGAVTNQGTAVLTLDGSTITGSLTNTGTGQVSVVGSSTVDGDMTNSSTSSGAPAVAISTFQTLDITGTLINGTATEASTISVASGATLEAGTIENVNGTISLGAGATLSGTANTLNNGADIDVADAGVITDAGDINNLNSGVITFEGDGTLVVDNDNSGGEVIDNAGSMNFTGGAGTTVNINSGATTAVLNNSGGFVVGEAMPAGMANTTVGSAVDLDFNNDAASGLVLIQDYATLNTFDFDNTVSGAQAILNGEISIDGMQVFSNAGTVDVNDGGLVTGNFANLASGDTDVESGGEISGTVSNASGGIVDVASGGTIGGQVTNDGTLETAGALDGGLTNQGSGSADLEGGTIGVGVSNTDTATIVVSGSTSVTGAFSNTSTATDAVTVNGAQILDVSGTLTNEGEIEILAGGEVEAGLIDNNTGSSISVGAGSTLEATTASPTAGINNATTISVAEDGTVTAAGLITNETGGIIDFNGASGTATFASTGTGSIVNDGDLNVNGAGAVSVTGNLTNNSTLDVLAGSMTGITTLQNNLGGTLNVDAGTTLGATTTINDGVIDLDGTLSGALTNNLTVNLNDGGEASGTVTNMGTIIADGSNTLGSLDNSGGTLDLSDGVSTGDVTTISGGLIGGGGSIDLDIDLGDTTGGLSGNADRVLASGGSSGAVTLNLTTTDTGELQTDPTILFTDGLNASVDANTTFTVSGLPAAGTILYTAEALDENVIIRSQVNPAIAGVAGNVNLVSSLIGTIVNRPTSPFVGGLYSQEGGDCGYGAWSRIIGGSLDADGSTNNGTADIDNSTDLDYGGLQIGGDFGCFNGAYNGWDLAWGGFLGLTSGSSTQRFEYTGAGGGTIISGTPGTSGITDTDFDQRYAGLYLSGASGAFSFDLQFRKEDTDYDITNTSLSLDDARVTNDSYTFSGSANYAIPVNESGLTFIPTVGFGITNNDLSDLEVNSASGSGTLSFEDENTETGFIGATLANTTISPSGLSATNVFGTATAYTDFNNDQISTFTTGGGTSQQLVTEAIGTFGELSVGVNHVRILDGAGSSNARQLSASARLDYRFNSDIDSLGVTAQVRLQF